MFQWMRQATRSKQCQLGIGAVNKDNTGREESDGGSYSRLEDQEKPLNPPASHAVSDLPTFHRVSLASFIGANDQLGVGSVATVIKNGFPSTHCNPGF